ncbi:MAG: hypothetical protein KKB05_04290, partial [Proteobacteria bacterium]|nr:hypothetical protein [Pseudomonadota bacterium]
MHYNLINSNKCQIKHYRPFLHFPKAVYTDQDNLLKSKNESGGTQRPNIITIMCALYIFHVIGII